MKIFKCASKDGKTLALLSMCWLWSSMWFRDTLLSQDQYADTALHGYRAGCGWISRLLWNLQLLTALAWWSLSRQNSCRLNARGNLNAEDRHQIVQSVQPPDFPRVFDEVLLGLQKRSIDRLEEDITHHEHENVAKSISHELPATASTSRSK